MDENKYKREQSWDPLNYTQNLCVVSNARNEALDQSFEANQQFVEQLSALNIETQDNNHSNDSNRQDMSINEKSNQMTKLINGLIASQSRDSRDSVVFNTNKVLIGDNPNVKTNRLSIVYNNNANNCLFNCGDIAVDNENKYHLNGMNGMTSSHSVYNLNSMPFIRTQEAMLSQNYADMKSFPQIRAMNTTSAQHLSQQLSHQMPHELPHDWSQQKANEASVRPKSQPMPYNQNQTYPQLMPIIDHSLQDNSQTSRHMRSIRARNSSHNAIESINKLNYHLERCYEQFKYLEKERKKIECELSHAFSGHKISSANNIPIQRPPQNATKMDRLITDMSREHAKVITIIAKMEQLRDDCELSESIHNSVQKWLEMIRKLQMKRKDEMLSNTGFVTEVFVEQISDLVKELTASARAVRTGLWCAYVYTIYEKRFS